MGIKILVVEDEQLVALDIQRRLTQLGHTVVAIADCAQDALDAVAHHHPDLVLMDIQLKGGINGIAIATQIREQFHLPVIFLTAHADLATINHAKDTKPFGYLVKPIQTQNLSTAIEIALSRHEAELAMQRALVKEQQLTEALRKALVKEKELNELKSQFISIISHEFRNPLSAIVLTLSILERPDDQLTPEKQQTRVRRAQASAQILTQLIEDVLNFSEVEAIQFQPSPAPINILAFCQDLADEFRVSTPQHKICLDGSSCSATESLIYYLDAKLLRHILTNLLSNAVKYSLAGSEVKFELICHPETVTFRIQDQGVGIAEDDQAKLFTPFRRGSNVGKVPGTGLGLSIVKKCVDAHDGIISLKSEVGVGTTFTVTLRQKR